MLEMSRDAQLVKTIVEKKLYFEAVNQVNVTRREHEPLASIVDTESGQQVLIGKLMGWYSANIFSDFFCALYNKAIARG
jgi:hypothetical protein